MHKSKTNPHRFPHLIAGQFLAGILAGLLCVSSTGSSLPAQDKEEKEIPKPRRMQLKTKDGVQLNVAYFGPIKGKDAMPVIMLHDWQSQGSGFYALALQIQKQGHAVLVPDLRGHGMSTSVIIRKPNGLTDTRDINPDKFTKLDIISMARDIEACKRFFLERHNAGELNIEKLAVIGDGLGGLIAMNWAVGDWNAQSTPFLKQGQDVKSLVLLSPKASFKGVTNQVAMMHPIVAGQLNTLLLVGNESSKELSDTKRIYNRMERFHGEKPTDQAELKAHKLFMFEIGTDDQGTDLLNRNAAPDLKTIILTFLNQKIAQRDTFTYGSNDMPLEWKKRGSVFANDDE